MSALSRCRWCREEIAVLPTLGRPRWTHTDEDYSRRCADGDLARYGLDTPPTERGD